MSKPSAAQMLKDAFNRGSLVHLAMDLQGKYFRPGPNSQNDDVYRAVKKVSEICRPDVPNVWSVWAGEDKPLEGGDRFHIVEPAEDEKILYKDDLSLLTSEKSKGYLKEHFDTVLITGVTSYACVKATIEDLDEAGFNVIAVYDAIDSASRSKDGAKEWYDHTDARYMSIRSLQRNLKNLRSQSPQ